MNGELPRSNARLSGAASVTRQAQSMHSCLPIPYLICAAAGCIAWHGVAAAQTAREQPLTEFAEFNQHVEDTHRKGEGWTSSARSVALSFVGTDCDCEKRSILEQSSPGQPGTTIIITDKGLHDDSVGAERYRIVLTASAGGVWQIDRGTLAWSCRSGRGHQDFSAELCE